MLRDSLKKQQGITTLNNNGELFPFGAETTPIQPSHSRQNGMILGFPTLAYAFEAAEKKALNLQSKENTNV